MGAYVRRTEPNAPIAIMPKSRLDVGACVRKTEPNVPGNRASDRAKLPRR